MLVEHDLRIDMDLIGLIYCLRMDVITLAENMKRINVSLWKIYTREKYEISYENTVKFL